MTTTPADFRVATCNACKELDAKDAKTTVNLAMDHADVVLWQEIETDGHEAAINARHDFVTYWPGGSADAVPISIRKSRFRFVSHKKTLLHLGQKGVTPARWTITATLRDLVTGQQFAVQNSHLISQAWTSHPERRPRWNKGAATITKRAGTAVKNRGALIGGLDANNPHRWHPSGTTATVATHGTYGTKFYDTLYFDGAIQLVSRAVRIATPSDHDILVAVFRRIPAKPPTKPKPPVVLKGAAKVIALAKAEVGYHEGRTGGYWNNHQKYSAAVPGLEWSQNQPWCATFMAWLALKSGYPGAYPKTASCDVGAAWFKTRHQWSEVPSVGAQVFFGKPSDLQHTGLVIAFDATTITTIEGNTNTSGSSQGDGVYRLVHHRRDAWVVGYGHPTF